MNTCRQRTKFPSARDVAWFARETWLIPTLLAAVVFTTSLSAAEVPQFSVYEIALQASGKYANPYVDLAAEAVLTEPDGTTTRRALLFWDGGNTWKLRFAPDKPGEWKWTTKSPDKALDGRSGSFVAVASARPGSVRPMKSAPHHFERQDGSPFWFMGDTAWALFTDNAQEKHDRQAAERFLDARAAQGFNVVHSMLLSEAGWGNRGGLPFDDIGAEKINPAYWQEVDHRLAYANGKGIVCGLAIAWGDKRKEEPFAWRKFPSVEARKRYAQYIAARYAAYDVYFLVAGEWHGEVRTRPAKEEAVRREFIEIGDALRATDPHGRMIGIHPMTSNGSVREFNAAGWMSFGDYQQNYHNLHARMLESLKFNKPVVNSEYGYFLRDQSGDGVPDKDNSTSIQSMRHATWDIAMAGGYVVTGFGTTYFGGNRDPGPFDLTAEKNRPWESQMGHMKQFFTGLSWWKLQPHDELLRCKTPRGADTKHLGCVAPPATTYWCLAEPGRQYVVYVRGLSEPVDLTLAPNATAAKVRQWNPRTGQFAPLDLKPQSGRLSYRPPDKEDWALLVSE